MLNETILPFLLEHWALSAAFVLVLAALLFTVKASSVRGVKLIDPQELIALMNNSQAIILDNRPVNVFKAGHILGSVHILPDVPEAGLPENKKYKNVPVVIVGETHTQALKSCGLLQKQYPEGLFCLKGGISAWRGASLPLIQN